ncbi:unnamed protein product [Pleuronectes platessa]|uniref:Uncharacterized protein n=1 Tax=Pleuronectes platessa TaxID=8262 RepID=A0A9N7UES7_PLEPL|nr:unnamed protein product [Pleuronectes platessa]
MAVKESCEAAAEKKKACNSSLIHMQCHHLKSTRMAEKDDYITSQTFPPVFLPSCNKHSHNTANPQKGIHPTLPGKKRPVSSPTRKRPRTQGQVTSMGLGRRQAADSQTPGRPSRPRSPCPGPFPKISPAPIACAAKAVDTHPAVSRSRRSRSRLCAMVAKEHRGGIVPVSPLSASNRFQLVPVTQNKSPMLQHGLGNTQGEGLRPLPKKHRDICNTNYIDVVVWRDIQDRKTVSLQRPQHLPSLNSNHSPPPPSPLSPLSSTGSVLDVPSPSPGLAFFPEPPTLPPWPCMEGQAEKGGMCWGVRGLSTLALEQRQQQQLVQRKTREREGEMETEEGGGDKEEERKRQQEHEGLNPCSTSQACAAA